MSGISLQTVPELLFRRGFRCGEAEGLHLRQRGGIGGGAQNALAQAGIQLYGGVSGTADEAVNALLTGTLGYNPNVHCSHHDHEGEGHACGEHSCGEHSCH